MDFKTGTQMTSRNKMKYVIITALIIGFIALLVMTIISLTAKSDQDLRLQEMSTPAEMILPTTQDTTSIQTTEIFLGCFDVLADYSSSLLVLYDSCQLMKGDGHCDDICNYPELNFDGGDCCQEVIDRSFCSDCFCYQDCSKHPDEAGK